MADPIDCLRGTTIFIALWSIFYSILQIVVFAWQTKYVKDRQWEYENRQLPADGAVDGFQARFPGLYGILTETPGRRRINALFALAIATLIVALTHFVLSVMLLFGASTKRANYVWPWFFTALPIIIFSTAYAVVWWTGDIFGIQLTMSVAEFVASLAVNSICFVIVLLYFFRLKGSLKSSKPLGDENHFKNPFKDAPGTVPPWRGEWNAPKQLSRKTVRRREHKSVLDPRKAKCREVRDAARSHPNRVRSPTSSVPLGNRGQRQLTVDVLTEHNRMLSGEPFLKYSYEGRTDRNTAL